MDRGAGVSLDMDCDVGRGQSTKLTGFASILRHKQTGRSRDNRAKR